MLAETDAPAYDTDMDASTLSTLFTIAATGLLAGAGFPAFLGAALGASLAAWWHRRPFFSTDRLAVTLDPNKPPDSAILLEAFRQTLARLRQSKRAARLRISAFRTSRHPQIRLDVTRDGDLEVACDGKRARTIRHPGVWVADHPLPLVLPHTRCLTLHFTPTTGERVRVAVTSPPPHSRRTWGAAALLAAAACACDATALFAAALGFAFQTYLLAHHAEGTRRQP
jgi:hypothetical protein